MRRQLMPFVGCKYPFSATVDAFGLRKMPYRGAEPTMALKDILLHVPGSVLVPVDHVWVCVGKRLAQFNPSKGDRICFHAWVQEYSKYNYNTGESRLDYSIERLSALDHIQHSCSGADFVTFWRALRRSRRFVTDGLDGVVGCTARVPERRDEPCTA